MSGVRGTGSGSLRHPGSFWICTAPVSILLSGFLFLLQVFVILTTSKGLSAVPPPTPLLCPWLKYTLDWTLAVVMERELWMLRLWLWATRSCTVPLIFRWQERELLY